MGGNFSAAGEAQANGVRSGAMLLREAEGHGTEWVQFSFAGCHAQLRCACTVWTRLRRETETSR